MTFTIRILMALALTILSVFLAIAFLGAGALKLAGV
jgi:hypothetical protein